MGVMVHDTIPLDLPEHHRPGLPESFAARMGVVRKHADLILCPSHHAAERVHAHLSRKAEVVAPGFEPLPRAEAHADAAYFVCLGTIDARKNQELLLDVWEALGPDAPHLHLVGRRGWCTKEFTRRLDSLPPTITEHSHMDDADVAKLLAGATALLHPSLAEGYGFTLLEAAALGVPVVAGNLPVYLETLGHDGVYLALNDRYQWQNMIQSLAATQPRGQQRQAYNRWDAHLDQVLSLL